MDSITFELDGHIIQLCNGLISIWRGSAYQEPAVQLPIERLTRILSTASLLRTERDAKQGGLPYSQVAG